MLSMVPAGSPAETLISSKQPRGGSSEAGNWVRRRKSEGGGRCSPGAAWAGVWSLSPPSAGPLPTHRFRFLFVNYTHPWRLLLVLNQKKGLAMHFLFFNLYSLTLNLPLYFLWHGSSGGQIGEISIPRTCSSGRFLLPPQACRRDFLCCQWTH